MGRHRVASSRVAGGGGNLESDTVGRGGGPRVAQMRGADSRNLAAAASEGAIPGKGRAAAAAGNEIVSRQ